MLPLRPQPVNAPAAWYDAPQSRAARREIMQIQRVGVIGAGTMGAAIAALLAGAGLSVVLLDQPPEQLTAEEAAAGRRLSERSVRDRFAAAGFARMRAARPANLLNPADSERITVGNTADDLELLADCDWIIEVILEQLQPKLDLLQRLNAVVSPTAVVTSNTSGIPIAALAAACSPDLQRRFFGSHFFNPPRYLKLLELIPGPATDPALITAFADFAADRLGKGIVICHDRPNFIGNRIFAYSALRVLQYALDQQCRVDDVDALTGPLIGRPSTATFRLLDAVGLDVMQHVTDNLYAGVPDDESHALFAPHPLLQRMIAARLLGRKAGQGFYREQRSAAGREYHVLDLQSFSYQPARPFPRLDELQAAVNGLSSVERIRLLLARAAADPADSCANLVAAAIYPSLAYAARRLPEIADSVADVDRAVRWGFAHEFGPFELWQQLGIAETAAALRAYGETLPAWIDLLISSATPFYQQAGVELLAYHVPSAMLRPLPRDPRELPLSGPPIAGTPLIALTPQIAAVVLPARAGLFDGRSADRLRDAVAQLNADPQLQALIISGADGRLADPADAAALRPLLLHGDLIAAQQRLAAVHALLSELHDGNKPVYFVAAGRLLDSTLSLAEHCTRLTVGIETAVGLTALSSGLPPLGGSAVTLNRRLIAAAVRRGEDPHAALRTLLEQLLLPPSGSAAEAQHNARLSADAVVVFNHDRLFGSAVAAIDSADAPPADACYRLGRSGRAEAARLCALWRASGRISAAQHSLLSAFAALLCGSDERSGWCSSSDLLAEEVALLPQIAAAGPLHDALAAAI
jgi:3-hydroxyacyl-CoA dehydrogenase